MYRFLDVQRARAKDGCQQYPYLTLFNTLIPALLAGNTVILKPSPQTPTVAEQVQNIFHEAGLPKDVLQYFQCGSLSPLEEMIRSTSVQLVCFTGSVAGGLAVQKAASERVAVRVGLELGGKDPAYVRDDVDLEAVAAGHGSTACAQRGVAKGGGLTRRRCRRRRRAHRSRRRRGPAASGPSFRRRP